MATDAAIQSYKELRVWREAMDLAVACYRLSARFPREEPGSLAEEVLRSAVAVPAGIAQGHEADDTDYHVECLQKAQSALKQLEHHVMLAEGVGLAKPAATTPILAHCQDIGKLLDGMIHSLQPRGTGRTNDAPIADC
jgi:four helix bundle protein